MNEPTRGAKSPFLHCPPPQNILGTGFRGSMKHRKSEEGETEFQNTFGRTLRGVDFHVYSSNKFMDTFVLSFRFCRCLIDEYGNTTKAPTTRCSRLTHQTLCACAYWHVWIGTTIGLFSLWNCKTGCVLSTDILISNSFSI